MIRAGKNRRLKKGTGLYEFLESSGILENGSDEQIKGLKKAYRKIYFTKHKKIQRREKPEFSVCFSRENGDYGRLALAAKRHKMAPTAFIRSAALSYIEKSYIVPDRAVLARIEQMLAQCLNEIQTICKKRERFNWEREQKFEEIEKRIETIRFSINNIFSNPPSLEDAIREALQKNPSFKNQLQNILACCQ